MDRASFSRAGRIHRGIWSVCSLKEYAANQWEVYIILVCSFVATWMAARTKQQPRPRELSRHTTRHVSIARISKDQSSSASPEPEQQTTSFFDYSYRFLYAEIMRTPIPQGVPLPLAGEASATHSLLANSFPMSHPKEAVKGW